VPTKCSMRAAIRDIQFSSVATDTQAMRANPGWDEADFSETVAIDQVYPIGHHISDVEHLTVGRDSDILRHASVRELQVTENFEAHEINFDEAAAEFTGEDRIPTIHREIRMIYPSTMRD